MAKFPTEEALGWLESLVRPPDPLQGLSELAYGLAVHLAGVMEVSTERAALLGRTVACRHQRVAQAGPDPFPGAGRPGVGLAGLVVMDDLDTFDDCSGPRQSCQFWVTAAARTLKLR